MTATEKEPIDIDYCKGVLNKIAEILGGCFYEDCYGSPLKFLLENLANEFGIELPSVGITIKKHPYIIKRLENMQKALYETGEVSELSRNLDEITSQLGIEPAQNDPVLEKKQKKV